MRGEKAPAGMYKTKPYFSEENKKPLRACADQIPTFLRGKKPLRACADQNLTFRRKRAFSENGFAEYSERYIEKVRFPKMGSLSIMRGILKSVFPKNGFAEYSERYIEKVCFLKTGSLSSLTI